MRSRSPHRFVVRNKNRNGTKGRPENVCQAQVRISLAGDYIEYESFSVRLIKNCGSCVLCLKKLSVDATGRKKARMRKLGIASLVLVLVAVAIAFGAVSGCSGDSTVVAQGDPAVLRKKKADALEKTLYPNGKPAATTTKHKGKR